ncbi:LysE family translocator, partial [archaeon]|nr:LysE family translocator [archaeon]
YAGSAYLLWLAYSTQRAGKFSATAATVSSTDLQNFRRGFLTNLLNPKVILFISVFLVQFTAPGHKTLFRQMVSLGAILALMSSGFFICLGTISSFLGKPLLDRDAFRIVLPKILSLVFLGLAVHLLIMARPV